VPSGYDPSKPLPLVLAWHGLGGSGTLARRYFGIEARSAGGAILVYPDGLPQGTDNQTGWDLAATGIDVAFFDALVAETSKAYCVDSKRIFNTGHSFGAMMSNALGCFRGDVLRAIAPVAGMPPRAGGRPGSAATCAGEVAAWIAHGENDETVDFTSGGVATRDFWIGRNGCSASESTPATPAECVAYSACKADLPVQWCVHQDGHNWPSFGGAAIWTFFASFQ
jgi:poly(3-hydroxybutyrate) depolymerase